MIKIFTTKAIGDESMEALESILEESRLSILREQFKEANELPNIINNIRIYGEAYFRADGALKTLIADLETIKNNRDLDKKTESLLQKDVKRLTKLQKFMPHL